MPKGLDRGRFMLRCGGMLLAATLAFGQAHAADQPAEKPAAHPRGGMTLPPPPAFINIGINVIDVEKSRKFYVEALGFTDGGMFKPDSTTGKVYRTGPDTNVKTGTVRLGPVSLLIREFVTPKYVGTTGYFPINQLGLGNIAVTVKDMDATVELVKKYGGKIEEETRAMRAGVGPLMLFITDPDGIRIELLQFFP
jgi:catechol 2,3-dioxygenase-like lactoylglutathione lyase family enzyme